MNDTHVVLQNSECGTYKYFGEFNGVKVWVNFEKQAVTLKALDKITFRKAKGCDNGEKNSSN